MDKSESGGLGRKLRKTLFVQKFIDSGTERLSLIISARPVPDDTLLVKDEK
jgi:hypothetical protein